MELSIELPEGIRRTGPAEAQRIGEITAEAFRDDPFNLWLFRNFAGIRALFLLQALAILLKTPLDEQGASATAPSRAIPISPTPICSASACASVRGAPASGGG